MNSLLRCFGLKSIASCNQEAYKKRFGADAQTSSVYQQYFSSYSRGFVDLDQNTLDLINWVAFRKKMSAQIANEWGSVFFGEGPVEIGRTHRPLPCRPELLEEAIKTQFVFEEELLQIKEVDELLKLRCERVEKEIDSLRRAKGWRWYFLGTEEYKYIAEIEKRAKAKGVAFAHEADRIIREKQGLACEINRRVAQIRSKLLSNPNLMQMRADAIQVRFNQPALENQRYHQTFKDHCVYVSSDPIVDREAVFFIIKRPTRMSDATWAHFTSQAYAFEIENTLKRIDRTQVKANTIFYPFQGYKDVEVSYEPAATALRLHEDRDIREKTRRKVKGDGTYMRTNRPDESNFIERGWRGIWGGWSKHREATAGADYHEAISVSRKLMLRVLEGGADSIEQRTMQNLGEYFDSLPHNDVASLDRSYGNDPNFLQMFRLHQFIQDQARAFYEKRSRVVSLQEAIRTPYTFKKEPARLELLVQDLFESYENWRKNLRQFITNIDDPIRNALGPHLVSNLEKFYTILQEFLRDAPHPEIAEVIQERARVRNQGQAALDQVWIQWKQNKSREDIDKILKESLAKVRDCVKTFNQALVVISAPLSSPSFQAELLKLIPPQLVPVYNAAFPPFYQNKAKVKIFTEEILKGTDTSPLWLEESDTIACASSELAKNEFIRSRLAKLKL